MSKLRLVTPSETPPSSAPYREALAVVVAPRARVSWWRRLRCALGGHVLTIAVFDCWIKRDPAPCPRCGVMRASPLLGGWSEDALTKLWDAATEMKKAEESRDRWQGNAEERMMEAVIAYRDAEDRSRAAAEQMREAVAKAGAVAPFDANDACPHSATGCPKCSAATSRRLVAHPSEEK